MMPMLLPKEHRIMENEAEIRKNLDAGSCPGEEFTRLSDELLIWASEWIQGRAVSKPGEEEGVL